MSPPVADEDDHSAKSKENQALPLPVSLRQYLPYEIGRTGRQNISHVPNQGTLRTRRRANHRNHTCHGQEHGKEAQQEPERQLGRAVRDIGLGCPRQIARISCRQLKPASLRTAAIWVPLLPSPVGANTSSGCWCAKAEVRSLRLVAESKPQTQ